MPHPHTPSTVESAVHVPAACAGCWWPLRAPAGQGGVIAAASAVSRFTRLQQHVQLCAQRSHTALRAPARTLTASCCCCCCPGPAAALLPDVPPSAVAGRAGGLSASIAASGCAPHASLHRCALRVWVCVCVRVRVTLGHTIACPSATTRWLGGDTPCCCVWHTPREQRRQQPGTSHRSGVRSNLTFGKLCQTGPACSAARVGGVSRRVYITHAL